MLTTTEVIMDHAHPIPAKKENDKLSVVDVTKGIFLYLALYLVQRAESVINRLRGRPSGHYDNW
jgi:hypothetical protein